MFIHIIAVDRQLSVHTKEGRPLSAAIDEAFRYYGKKRTAAMAVTTLDGEDLDPKQPAEDQNLGEDSVIRVGAPEESVVAPEEEEVVESPRPRKSTKKTTKKRRK